MSLFNSQTFSAVEESAAGSYVNGLWVPAAAASPITFQGTLQPTSGYTIQNLLEGKRYTALAELITAQDLAIADPSAGKSGAKITDSLGNVWTILLKAPCQNGILPHFEYTVIRLAEALP